MLMGPSLEMTLCLLRVGPHFFKINVLMDCRQLSFRSGQPTAPLTFSRGSQYFFTSLSTFLLDQLNLNHRVSRSGVEEKNKKTEMTRNVSHVLETHEGCSPTQR